MAIERIKLNLIPAGTMPVCHASQYDKKRQIGIDIYNGLQPYILSDELLELDVRKPDGHIVTIDVPYTAGGNGVVFETTEQMCAVAGSNLCELKITKGEAEIGSLNFYMEIERSPMENGLASDSEIANLRTQMQSIAQPMLDDLVPPMVESLVPEVVGENYYNKNEINNIVSGIDDALEGIGHDIDGINDDIDNLETELESKANANEVAQALEDKADKETTYTKEEVDDIVYNILPDDTASGSVATFETDLALPIKSLEIDVNAKQDLHGYDYPWTAGGGKNILLKPFVHYSLAPNNLEDMFFIKAGDYRFSFSDSTATNWRVGMRMKDAEGNDLTDIAYKPNSGMSWRSAINCWLGGSDSTTKSLSITIVEDCYIRMIFGLASTTADTEFTNVQLEKGTTQTSYEPVENICPIEGWSEIELVHVGKNLLDTTGTLVHNNYNFAGFPNTLKPNTTYTYSVNGSTSYKYALWLGTSGTKANSTTRRLVSYIQSGTSVSFTTPSEMSEEWLIIAGNVNGAGNEDFVNIKPQVELGSTATEYEPYVGNEYIINLGGTYYGGHLTQDKDGHRRFEVTYKKLVLTGTENWAIISAGTASRAFIDKPTDKKLNDASTICNRFSYGNAENIGEFDMGNLYFRFNIYGIADSKESFNAWLLENETYVVYPLATPIIIDLPDGEPIITLVGTNNIYADTGDTSVVFKNSVNGYVEKKIAGVQALALNT